MISAQGDSEKSPDFHLFDGKFEIGAAWQKPAKDGKAHYTVKIDDPTFQAPVFARLIEGGDDYALVWTGEKPKAKD